MLLCLAKCGIVILYGREIDLQDICLFKFPNFDCFNFDLGNFSTSFLVLALLKDCDQWFIRSQETIPYNRVVQIIRLELNFAELCISLSVGGPYGMEFFSAEVC